MSDALTDLLNPRLTADREPGVDLDWNVRSVEEIAAPAIRKTRAELDVILQRGIDLHTRGQIRPAMECYHEVLLHDRGDKKALYFSAIALSQQNRNEQEVLAVMRHAVAQLPDVPEAYYNLGILLHRLGYQEEARENFEKAIELRPDLTEAKTSLAGACLNAGDAAMGRYWLEAAANTYNAQADSVYSRAFAKLTIGNLWGGFSDYESRWKTASFLAENKRDFGPARYWNGKPIPGKTLYIHTEQGAGDVIMFSRFIEQVAQRSQARTVVLEVGETLVDHLAQLRGVDLVIPSNTPVPEEAWPIHRYLPMMGMMLKCGIFHQDRITHAGGWLTAPQPKPEIALAMAPALAAGKLRVGIAWAGSKAHKNDRYRSIAWSQFRDDLLWDAALDQVAWFSLQVGDRARDMDDRGDAALDITDLTPHLTTYADTAAACAALDYLVCVDTATLHAAASLVNGPKVLALIPAAPDWRWLLDGERTAWYEKVRLIRQDRATDWRTPLVRAAALIASSRQ